MNSLLDDVNALLKLKQGDLVRLGHIKKTLQVGHILYISDSKYLRELTKQYLEDYTGKRLSKYSSYDYPEYADRLKDTLTSEPEHISDNLKEREQKKIESNGDSFCSNCGNTIKNENFCTKCGSSLHLDVSENEHFGTRLNESKSQKIISYQKNKGMRIRKKLLIGLGVLFIVIIVGAITIGGLIIGSIGTPINEEQKFKDELFDGLSSTEKAILSAQFEDCRNNMGYLQSVEMGKMLEQRCMDSIINSIEEHEVATNLEMDPDWKCGAGTVFDETTYSCIVG